MVGIWELLDGKILKWDLSFGWEWNGNGNDVIKIGGNWHEKSTPRIFSSNWALVQPYLLA